MEAILITIIVILIMCLWGVLQSAKAQKTYTDYWYDEYKKVQKNYFELLKNKK